MKRKLKLFFTDFWPNFKLEDNYFLDILSPIYDITISDDNPDFLFYSVFGTKYHRYDCPRIFYTGENIRADFNECDFAFTFDYSQNQRHFRLPLYPFFGDISRLIEPKSDIDQLISQKTGFCNFIYSNAGPRKRIEFFNKLNKYKKIDSAGRLLNNMNERVNDKHTFLQKYKFTIAFENESYPGYTTEKIFEPMLANSIPIYWGNPLVGKDFNTKSFLNWHDYGSDEALIERIIEIDRSDVLLAEYLSAPNFENNHYNEYVDPDKIRANFIKIFESEINPIALQSDVFRNSGLKRDMILKKIDLGFKIKHYNNVFSNLNIRKIKIKIKKKLEKK